MAELSLIRGPEMTLIPASEDDQAFVRKLKTGEVIYAEFRKRRNPKFHRKFFALLKLGYDHFKPQTVRLDGSDQVFTPEKNMDEFRRLVIVKAGYYHVIAYPDGSVRLRARSLKFSRMDQEEFERLYSAALDVLLQFVLHPNRGWSREQVDQVLERIMNFT